MTSPRFGNIRCLRTNRLVKKGEELFVDYNYSLKGDEIPPWFIELHEEHYGKEETDKKRAKKTKKEEEESEEEEDDSREEVGNEDLEMLMETLQGGGEDGLFGDF